MASDGPTLERSEEVRERPSLEGSQEQQPHHEATGLHRTAEIHETQSHNLELRKDPDHTTKPLVDPEQILDPRGASAVSKPEDILAVRRDETDTPLE